MMKNEKVLLIKNEQHNLLPEQQEILEREFPNGYEILNVPAEGWTLEEQEKVALKLLDFGGTIIFLSPVPYLLKRISLSAAFVENMKVLVFHNDNREKKELPNGKIIQTVAKTGWVLV